MLTDMLPGRLSRAESGLSKEQKVIIYQWLWSGRQSHSSTESQQVTELTLTGIQQKTNSRGCRLRLGGCVALIYPQRKSWRKNAHSFSSWAWPFEPRYLVPWITRLKRFKSLALKKQNRKGCQLIIWETCELSSEWTINTHQRTKHVSERIRLTVHLKTT